MAIAIDAAAPASIGDRALLGHALIWHVMNDVPPTGQRGQGTSRTRYDTTRGTTRGTARAGTMAK